MNFTELVEIMSSNGVVNLADIARELEVSPQSVSNWKARDRVPYKYVVEVQNRYQPSHDGNNQAEPITTRTQESSAPRMRSAPLPPFLVEEEKTFSLAELLMPVAQNLRFTIRSTVVMTMVGVMIFLFSSILALFSKQEPEKIYVTTAKLVIPGGISTGGGGGGASGILGRLGISVPSGGGGGPSPTLALTSPSLYPEFLKTHSFAKRLLGKKFETEKYGEQTLLEIALQEKEKKLNKPKTFPWESRIPGGYGVYQDSVTGLFAIDRDQGLDTLVMQNMDVLSDTVSGMGMIQFSQAGSFQTITTRAIEPQLAVDIAYVVLDELQEFTKYFSRIDLDKTRTFIEQRLKAVEDEYEALEEKMKVFKETNRAISSISLQLQEERLSRDLGIYKGIYTTLYQNLEQVKIQKEYELTPTIQILDYPIAPLNPTLIGGGASATQNPVFILLLGIVGLGFGVVVSLAKGYFSTVEEDEKERLKGVKEEAETTLKSVLGSLGLRLSPIFRRKRDFPG